MRGAQRRRAGSFCFDARSVREHHRDVVANRIDAPACGAFQALAVGGEPDGRLAERADENVQKLFADGHERLLRNSPTPLYQTVTPTATLAPPPTPFPPPNS